MVISWFETGVLEGIQNVKESIQKTNDQKCWIIVWYVLYLIFSFSAIKKHATDPVTNTLVALTDQCEWEGEKCFDM